MKVKIPTITKLTENCLLNMRMEDKNKRECKEVFLQYIGTTLKGENKKAGIVLSDGNLKVDALPSDKVSEVFLKNSAKSEIKPFFIIKAIIHYIGKEYFFLKEANVVNSKVNKYIGNPISYSQLEYQSYQNPRASSEIDPKFYEINIDDDESVCEVVSTQTSSILESFYNPIAILDDSPRKNWTCFGRCIFKSNQRQYIKNDQTQYLFSCVMKDDHSEIQLTFFSEEVEKFYKIIEEGKCYTFSKMTVQKKSRFNQTCNNYELVAKNQTEITICEDDRENKGLLPPYSHNFRALENLSDLNIDEEVNIYGVIRAMGIEKEVLTKMGHFSYVSKFSVGLGENKEVVCNIWGKFREYEILKVGDIIGFKGLKVQLNESQPSLNSNSKSRLLINPSSFLSSEEIERLKTLQFEGKPSNLFSPQTKKGYLVTLQEGYWKSQRDLFDLQKDATFFEVLGTIVKLPKSNTYQSCSVCKKKLQQSDFGFFCSKCDLDREMVPRYCSKITIADHTYSINASVMKEDVGLEIFGLDAYQMEKEMLKYGSGEYFFEDFIDRYNNQIFHFTIMAKTSSYEGKTNIQFTVIRANAKEHTTINLKLLDTLKCLILNNQYFQRFEGQNQSNYSLSSSMLFWGS